MRISLGVASLILAALPLCGQAMAGVERVTVNGRTVPAEFSRGEMRIPAGTTMIHFESAASGPEAARRIRFRLEGFDADWRERKSFMRLVVVFYDAQNAWHSQQEFIMRSTTPGWTGSVETSPLGARRETVKVPEGAVTFSITLTSAASPTELGTLAIGGLRVSESDGAAVFETRFPEPPGTEPEGWTRTGERPSMAKVLQVPGVPGGRVLAIIDEDFNAHADWRSRPVRVKAGGTLQLDWLESYSVSVGGRQYADYPKLTPGRYMFHFQDVTPAGQPVGPEKAMVLIVQPPFWLRPWFLVLSGMAIAGIGLGSIRYVSWRRTQREITRLRQQNALEAERARIARDIHDDLGATLAQISMLSQPGTTHNYPEAVENLSMINRATREMTQAMDEIVWAVNPRNDRLDRLVTFIGSYAQEYLTGIEFRCQYPDAVPECPIPAASRHNLFLAFKEALANAARHSGCQTVEITMKVCQSVFSLSLVDDGHGFDPQAASRTGNGLMNMRRRMEALGGRFSLESSPGHGSRVVLEMPLGEE